jgi:hypothetical protein
MMISHRPRSGYCAPILAIAAANNVVPREAPGRPGYSSRVLRREYAAAVASSTFEIVGGAMITGFDHVQIATSSRRR